MSAFPQNIFDPAPVPVANASFQQGSANPPVGWQKGNPYGYVESAVTLSYDTATQYQGIQSLVLAATAQLGGISSTSFPAAAAPNQLYVLDAALMSVSGDAIIAELLFFDINNNFLSSIQVSTTATSWQWLKTSGLAPANAAQVVLAVIMNGASGGTGEVGKLWVGVSSAMQYYLSLPTSQYQQAPKFMSLLSALLLPLVQAGVCASTMYYDFDLISGAVGPQLDVIGQLIGVSRTVNIPPGTSGGIATAVAYGSIPSGYINGDIITVVQAGGSGGEILFNKFVGRGGFSIYAPGSGYTAATDLSTTGGHGSGLAVSITVNPTATVAALSDNDYRSLLLATVARNNWDGQQDSLYSLWSTLFPGMTIAIADNLNMTATVFVSGNISAVMQQLILAGLIVPRPQGVQYNYVFNLPAFGCDLNNAFVSGVDTGYIT